MMALTRMILQIRRMHGREVMLGIRVLPQLRSIGHNMLIVECLMLHDL